jgi:hypothetical protein
VKPGTRPVSFSKQQANFLGRAPSFLENIIGVRGSIHNTAIVDRSPFIDPS